MAATDKLRTLKQTQLFISFPFFWLCNLKFVEPRRSNYSRLKIYSATHFAARGGHATRTPQAASLVYPTTTG